MPDFDRWTSKGGDPSLNDINRVDRFFDALGSKETAYSTDHAEAELSFLLADWRDEIRDAPVTVPVTTRDAAAALRGGLTSRKHSRSSFALVGSVAAALLCLGGFGAAVFGSGPGDAFYGIRTTLFGQQQVRDDQVALASAELQQVQQLIDQGQWEQAQDKLVAVSTTVQSVGAVEQKHDLIEQWNALTYKVVEQDPAATLPPPGEPLPVLPDSPLTLLPVPALDVDTTTSTSTTMSETTSTTATTSETTSTTSTTSETTTSETTSGTPGPEIVLPPPPSSTMTTSAPTSTPPTTTTTTTTPTTTTTTTTPTTTTPPTTTTTTTTIAAKSPAAEATSVPPVPSVPQIVAPQTASVTQAGPPASGAPPQPPQLAPSSPSASTPPAPPATGSPSSSPSVAPSQVEPTVATTTAPKRSSEEQEVTTTTVMPPR